MSSDRKCSRRVFLQRKDILTTSSSCSTTLVRQEMSADISCRRGCRSTVVQQLNDVVTLLDDVVDLFNDIHKDRKCLQTFFVVRVSSNSSTTSSSCRRTARRRRSTTRRHPQRHKMSADILCRCGCRREQRNDDTRLANDLSCAAFEQMGGVKICHSLLVHFEQSYFATIHHG